MKHSDTIFSIITVCLNAKKEIVPTSLSLKTQVFQNFEWIVIDGGSVDGTLDFLAGNDRITTYVSEPDSGIYEAMNKGIRLAKGNYCLFLNAGDYLFDNYVLYNVANSLGGDLIVGRMHVVAPPESKKKTKTKRYDTQNIHTKEYLYYRSLPHQATFIRRSVFDRFGEYDTSYKIIGDHDFFTRVLLNGSAPDFVDYCISIFPLNGISTQFKNSIECKKEYKVFRKRHFSLSFRLKRSFFDTLSVLFKKFNTN